MFFRTCHLSHHEFQFLPVRNQAPFESRAKNLRIDSRPFSTIIQRPMVYVHADKFICEVPAHIARILQRVLNRFGAMLELYWMLAVRMSEMDLRIAGSNRLFITFAPSGSGNPSFFAAPPKAQILAKLQALVSIR